MSMSDRRGAQRFDLHLPLRVHTADAPELEKPAETRDVSHRGVYFWFDRALDAGSEFEFVMVLPEEVTHTIPVKVKCHGKVIRSTPQEGGRVGVAAVIERYDFLRGEEEENETPSRPS